MEINEYLNYRDFLLDEAKDEEGFISDSAFLRTCLPGLNETKLIDTEDCNECYCLVEKDNLRIDGYIINESGERLQVFIINEDSLELNKAPTDLNISLKSYYEKQFGRAVSFIKKAIKRQLDDVIQESSPAKPLLSFLASSEAMDQIDVVEVFLISATVTVENRGEQPQPKNLEFEDDTFKVSYSKHRDKHEKDLIIMRRLIDLNFLHNVIISQGNREPLTINFTSPPFDYRISCIQAANEENFESFLCVIPAVLLAELYKKHSSRMLEKNVRSFLQLKGVNKGMMETISSSPEKFIAYNNGLTITATGKELLNENGNLFIRSLTDFQIVNGGQTTATIYFSRKSGLDISKISVMAKINVAKNATEEQLDELISNISTFSNAQSRVSKVDLRSRSTQLVRLKSLSESVLTPSGKKWFFERAKGEFNTLIRKNPHQKNRINREYPRERRFAKEELAKYYTSWSDQPFLVKKGGEKVFRYFIEAITGAGKGNKAIEIDRSFYEDLIAKIILFRTMEKIYGMGSKSIGQLRSAVVPYSISVLFIYTTGSKTGRPFDLLKIWKAEVLDEEVCNFLHKLMTLMNELIRKYSESDDLGEYSKKAELWAEIRESKEITEFMDQETSVRILERYTVTKETLRKREAKTKHSVDFSLLSDAVAMFNNGELFYKSILKEYSSRLAKGERNKLEQLISCLQNRSDVPVSVINFEKELLQRVRNSDATLFDRIQASEKDNLIVRSYNFILKIHNKAIENGTSVRSEFSVVKEIAARKGAKFYSVFDEVGKNLETGKLPTIPQLVHVGNYVELLTKSSD